MFIMFVLVGLQTGSASPGMCLGLTEQPPCEKTSVSMATGMSLITTSHRPAKHFPKGAGSAVL